VEEKRRGVKERKERKRGTMVLFTKREEKKRKRRGASVMKLVILVF
jgi:hypothetical protein